MVDDGVTEQIAGFITKLLEKPDDTVLQATVKEKVRHYRKVPSAVLSAAKSGEGL